MASGGETLTTVIAVVGCGLSIYNTVQARLDKRPKVKLTVSFGMIGLGLDLSNQKVFFTIVNGGTQTVHISSLYVPLPIKHHLIIFPEGPTHLPVSVEANTSQKLWVDYRSLYANLVKGGLGVEPRFRACVTDTLDRKHLSLPVHMPPFRG